MHRPFTLWQPVRELAAVQVHPLLASWDAATSPAQQRLTRYLDELREFFSPYIATAGAPLYLAVHAVVPDDRDLLSGCDLENYLTPIARALRPATFVLAHARKGHSGDLGQSRVSIGVAEAESARAGDGWVVASARGSTDRKEWKESVRDGLLAEGARPLATGAVAMDLAVRCSARRRNWVNLWKPAGDALGPLLGEPDPDRPFNPADDRITALSMHLSDVEALGYGVDLAVRARLKRAE